MLLPSVKSSMKYHFLGEIDQQCCDLCVRKHAPSVLHVCRKETKSTLESFTWSSVLQEMKERALDVLDFIATISVPVVQEKENQVPPLFRIPRVEKHLPKSRKTSLSFLVENVSTSSNSKNKLKPA